jgi:hypothetical protein
VDAEIDDLLHRYRDALLRIHAVRFGDPNDHDHQPRLVHEMQRIHLQLRETDAGRRGISSLMDDDNPTIRSWSAVSALAWDETRARAVLEVEVDDPGLGGLSAEWALRQFDKGALNTSWVPD